MPESVAATAKGGARLRLRSLTYPQAVLLAVVFTICGTALGAYNLGPLPVQWLAQSLVIAAAFLLSLKYVYLVPGSRAFACLFSWALVVTLLNAALRDFPSRMPALATTPYPIFIALRFVGLLAFAAAVCLVYWLLVEGYKDRVLRWIVWLGTAVAAVALYVYAAQLFGWWEPVRSRLSTGGGEQSIIFSYAFHRAMGTFREPSHLAEWLIVPFFLSFAYTGRFRYLLSTIIGSALLMTGSLTGIVGTMAGLIGAILLTNPFRGGKLRLLIQMSVALAAALLVFDRLAVSYGPQQVGLIEVLDQRISPILLGDGLSATNRNYVFQYAARQPLPIIGSGLGNANIVLSESLGNPLVMSYLSLYYNYLFSSGLIGILLLAVLLIQPLRGLMQIPREQRDLNLTIMLSAYLAWLLMYTVHSEEPAIMFGVIFALLAFEVRQRGRRTSPAP